MYTFVFEVRLETYLIESNYFVLHPNTGIFHEIGGEHKRLSKEESQTLPKCKTCLKAYRIDDSYFIINPNDGIFYEMETGRQMTDKEIKAYNRFRAS